MNEQKQIGWEDGLIFLMLGAESWYILFCSLSGQGSMGMLTGGYLLLLLAYPLSKRQKSNISKREAYLTIYLRWALLNLATVLYLCYMEPEGKRELVIRGLFLTMAGGLSLYILLAVFRLYTKLKSPDMKSLVLYGKTGHTYRSIEETIPAGMNRQEIKGTYISSDMELSELESRLQMYDRVYLLDIPAERRNEILKLCFRMEKPVYCISKISDIMVQGGYTVKDGDRPFFGYEKYRLDKSQAFVKRLFDILCSGIGLLLCLPLFLIIGCCIRLEDGGPVFYKQTRCTRDGRLFQIYKFRSMVPDAEPEGARMAEHQDCRVTKTGRFLRNTKLDELPQLWNVWIGDMSMVGPRPERPELIEEIRQQVPEFDFRTHVKAGLTGYAQVQGNYNTSPLDKLKWDLIYIQEYSFSLDLKIMIMTPFIILLKNNREE